MNLKNGTSRLPRPAALVLALAAAFCLASACPAQPKACAAAVVVSPDTPPEPITDGSYRDGDDEDGGRDKKTPNRC
ncbi:hypothetical protein Ppa06_64670 [Planomonospora parontospora subsp. parontospora]|uniref:Lipoprotein n=2 Tax=Planomonospora parontospora TaxID=58119 RepID=A0AA37BMQ4_9ACTN|nr:hypothetical protein [Planomonospora parontospora]GGK94296.1 hypothetical protein GCM10010126_62130 [Planomonospora parontospora]GII12669.1 hypothetical protein Ppa06_64670 [Planomonospora parontospora subsp. parontospora]